MDEEKIYLYILNTMADWEPVFAISELNTHRFFSKPTHHHVITVGPTKEPITSMGGLKIVPDIGVDEIRFDDAALLILPGGDEWAQPVHRNILEIAKTFLAKSIPVAAICGATEAMAEYGMLDNVKHTSNDLEELKRTSPNYKGAHLYQNATAVTDGNLITASGVAPIDFAYQILKKLNVMKPESLEAWYGLFTKHRPEDFVALVNSLSSE